MKKLIVSILLISLSYTTTVFATPQESELVTSIALNEIGYLEKQNGDSLYDPTANSGLSNYTKYAYDLGTDFYGYSKQGLPWCDVFVDWCFVQAFGVADAKSITYQNPYGSAGCSTSMEFYQAVGQLYQTPEPGDQIFFYYGGEVNHTGLVYQVDENTVYTIEGNTTSENGEGVTLREYDLNSSRIAGYGRPNYSLIATKNQAIQEEQEKIQQQEEKEQKIQNMMKYKRIMIQDTEIPIEEVFSEFLYS